MISTSVKPVWLETLVLIQFYLSLTLRNRETIIQKIERCQGKTPTLNDRKQHQNIALPGKHRSLQKVPGDPRTAPKVASENKKGLRRSLKPSGFVKPS